MKNDETARKPTPYRMVCTWQEAWTRYLPQDPGAGVAAGVAGNDGVPVCSTLCACCVYGQATHHDSTNSTSLCSLLSCAHAIDWVQTASQTSRLLLHRQVLSIFLYTQLTVSLLSTFFSMVIT